MWYLWHKSIRLHQLASYSCLLFLQGNLYGIDRSVSEWVHLPCIDRLLQGTLGTELLLQNYYNNVTVISKRRVVNTLTL